MNPIFFSLAATLVWTTALAEESPTRTRSMGLTLTSSAFHAGAAIPAKYTCDGENLSPPLSWTSVPAGTKSLALICDDPDAPAGIWVHWVLYGLPSKTSELTENVPPSHKLPSGAIQGTNDFKDLGYGGPCPPPGKPHHYHFKLYALDTELSLKPGANKQQLMQAMHDHILAQGELVGTYQRRK